ncbi:MAG: hypothetical protein ACE5IJ_04690 [Thermoplasmata archaeon]
MEDRDRPSRKDSKPTKTKVIDLSDKPEIRERVRNKRKKSSVISIAILLVVLLSFANVSGQGSHRAISAKLMDDNAVLESTGLSGNDVLLFEFDTSDASLVISHRIRGTQDFEVVLKLVSIIEFVEGVDDQHEAVNVVQIAGSPFSSRVYDLVLADVEGKGVEVSWNLGNDSSLTMSLELFAEDVSYESMEYGPANARMLFDISNFAFEVEDSEISLEAEILSPHASLAWRDTESFQEIFAGVPTIDIMFGFPNEILRGDKTKKPEFSYRETTGGLAFSSDYGGEANTSWVGFCKADIVVLEEEGVWHPVGDLGLFGGTLLVSAIVVAVLKLGFLRLWGRIDGGLTK